MIGMKGSFSQVIGPIVDEVVKPFLKGWAYWGHIEGDFRPIRENDDLIGFYVFVDTTRGTYVYKFKRKEDEGGYFVWEQVEERKISAKDDPRTIPI